MLSVDYGSYPGPGDLWGPDDGTAVLECQQCCEVVEDLDCDECPTCGHDDLRRIFE